MEIKALNAMATAHHSACEKGELFIGEKIPEISLTNIINYHKETATPCELRGNNNKLLLLQFWFGTCSLCKEQWEKLAFLQKQWESRLQIVLVTTEPAHIARSFINEWCQKNGKMELPVVTADRFLHESFGQLYNPHYVWIAPDGRVLAETDSSFVSAEQISALLHHLD